MKMFRKYDMGLQADRDKMIWTKRDVAFMCSVALVVGFFFGWIA